MRPYGPLTDPHNPARNRWFIHRAKRPDRTTAEARFEAICRTLDIPFKAQYVFVPYVVDYFLPAPAIVIEIDGGYHQSPDQQLADQYRTRQLIHQHGVAQVIRFQNEQVLGVTFMTVLLKALGRQAPASPPIQAPIRRRRFDRRTGALDLDSEWWGS